MPKIKKKYNKEIRFNVDEELHSALIALAERRGEPLAEICRRILKDEVSRDAAIDGIDTVTEAVRKSMQSVLKPLENRLAAMTSKSTIASATSMYMHQHLIHALGKDPRPIYEEARKKAVIYQRNKEDE